MHSKNLYFNIILKLKFERPATHMYIAHMSKRIAIFMLKYFEYSHIAFVYCPRNLVATKKAIPPHIFI